MKKYLIVGLGNPGPEYTYTRHNVGFRILENWLTNLNLTTKNFSPKLKISKKHQAKINIISLDNSKIVSAEPQTFMNNSGISVTSLKKYYDIPLENILIIHDDLSFPIGKLKLSKDSGPAGHNGVKSIINQLGSKNFSRLRIGIASVSSKCPVNHEKGHNFVLNKFTAQEEEIIDELLQTSSKIITYFIENNFEKTANKFNQAIN